MTIKELYSKDFETAVTELSYENDYITSIEVLKDFIIYNVQNDSFNLAAHVLDALLNYYADYYSYDYSMGTLESPKPLTELENLEEYCDDFKESILELEMLFKKEYEICSNLVEITENDIDTSYQYLITIINEELQKNILTKQEHDRLLNILDDLSLFWIDALSKALDYIYELGDAKNG